MAYYTRADIPFHYALADAFTVCDAYHCSLLGPTDPNRYHMWTGWVGNDGSGGGPGHRQRRGGLRLDDLPRAAASARASRGRSTRTAATASTRPASGAGPTTYIGNYGDNSLLYFHQYQNARPAARSTTRRAPARTSPRPGVDPTRCSTIFARGRARRPAAAGVVDRRARGLHRAPATGRPTTAPGTSRRCSTRSPSNPEVWSKTALFVTYDENDGFFDHMVPPTPPRRRRARRSTVDADNEIFAGNAGHPVRARTASACACR